MPLDLIRIHNLRNIKEVELKPDSRINLIHGNNGSGKTTLLESIYILGRGRSFRGTKTGSLIRDGQINLDLFGRFTKNEHTELNIGVRKKGTETEVRVNQDKLKKLSQLARLIPLQLLTPRSHEILERGPQLRRRFIEWGVFHVEPGYQNTFKRFSRALSQRNAALRGVGTAAEFWDQEFIKYSEGLDGYRQDYVSKLRGVFLEELPHFINDKKVELRWRRGWKEGSTLEKALRLKLESDIKLGFTQVGPQRADLQLLIEGDQITKRASRGEQKMIVSALQIAQARITKHFSEHCPSILVDDLTSELDVENRIKLIERLININAQLFITAIDRELFVDMPNPSVFHVEHGHITASTSI